MTVQQLIERLQQCDPNKTVVMDFHEGEKFELVTWVSQGFNELDGAVILES